MNSRERVRKALRFEEPDKVPVDLGGTRVSSIHAEAYTRLKQALGVNSGPIRIYDMFQMLAQVELPVIEALGVDILPVNPLRTALDLRIDEWKPFRFWWAPEWAVTEVPANFRPVVEADGSMLLKDPTVYAARATSRMPVNGWYFDRLNTTAMSDHYELEDVAAYKARKSRYTDEELDYVRAQADMLYRESDKALVGGFMGGGLWGPDSLSYADWLMVMVTEKGYVRDVFQALVEVALENLRAYRDAVGDKIEVVSVSGVDYGTQRGEFFSPDLFEELFVPYYRQINDWVHANTPWKTFFHSCGSVRRLVKHFIAAGVDILNPVQTSAANMDPAELKREFGGKIVFWGGGVDTQRTLPFGTPEEVREEVHDRLRTFGPNGGFVFNTVHNIQARVPTENMLAMYEAVKEFRAYPVAV